MSLFPNVIFKLIPGEPIKQLTNPVGGERGSQKEGTESNEIFQIENTTDYWRLHILWTKVFIKKKKRFLPQIQSFSMTYLLFNNHDTSGAF